MKLYPKPNGQHIFLNKPPSNDTWAYGFRMEPFANMQDGIEMAFVGELIINDGFVICAEWSW